MTLCLESRVIKGFNVGVRQNMMVHALSTAAFSVVIVFLWLLPLRSS